MNPYDPRSRAEKLRALRPLAVGYVAIYAIQLTVFAVANGLTPFMLFAYGVPLSAVAVWLALAVKHEYIVPTATTAVLFAVGLIALFSNGWTALAPPQYACAIGGFNAFFDMSGAFMLFG